MRTTRFTYFPTSIRVISVIRGFKTCVLAALVAFATPFSQAQPTCAPPPAGLIGWWAGEGSAMDFSTNHNDGANIGGGTYAPGEVGQAFSFTGQKQYVEIPYNASSPLFNLTTRFTYSLWINPNPAAFFYGGDGPLLDREQCGTTWESAELDLVGTNASALSVQLTLNYENGPNYTVFLSPTVITNAGWHHLAASYDKDSQAVKLYVDGTIVLTGTYARTIWLPSTPLFIGGAPMAFAGCSWEAYYAGLIDEAAVFNRALSDEEVASIYAAGRAGMCQPQLPPAITTQPQGVTNVFGGTAQFNVGATGSAPLSFQWRQNGTNLPNDTNSTLTLTSLVWGDAGSYDIIVSNNYGAVTSQAAALAVSFSAAIPTNGLVSWWRGEGNPKDTVGTNVGVLKGGLTDDTNGFVGLGFGFNGSDAFLSVPTFPNFSTNSFSLTLWYRAAISSVGRTGNQTMDLFNKGLTAFGTPVDAGCGLRLLDGDLNLCIDDQKGAPSEINLNLPEPSVNNWHHVVATLDRLAGLTALYLDGALAAQTNIGGLGSLDTDMRLAFGTLDRTPRGPIAEYYDGQMDEMMYYNRALGAGEVENLYVAQGGRPLLNAQSVLGGVLLSWPAACDGYWLESCIDLSAHTWQTVTNIPSLAGSWLQVSLPDNAPTRSFFRLHKPGR